MSAPAQPFTTVDCDLAVAHWGAYEISRGGPAPALAPWREDRDPSPIGLSMLDAYRSPLRIQRPAVRKGWLDGRRRSGRGEEPFVEVSWETALELVAGELRRVTAAHGNQAIFGGSYGWSSAGRFHHAQSQVHRFLNALGGYVRHTDSYSLGAGRVVTPHIVADLDELKDSHTSWEVLARHTRLFVTFGGVVTKNAQVNAGGAMTHFAPGGLEALSANGCKFVHIGPVRADLPLPDASVEWVPIRPNTDTAVMLALAHEVLVHNLQDDAFLQKYTTGLEKWKPYVLGASDGVAKTPAWAEAISGMPAARIASLARELAATRSLVNVSWSLQRADHGEQPFWACIALAALLGQVGLPGGGFGIGYGPANVMGSPYEKIPGPTFSQGRNAVSAFIPCARIADLLLHPNETFDYNGSPRVYPDIRLVYWAGGNPFHHHQDLHRLVQAWARPEVVICHEQVWNFHAKMADIVLPATSTLERDDLGFSSRESLLVAMRKLEQAPGEARDDYDIFADLSQRLGVAEVFTEGRTSAQWLRQIYGSWADKMRERGQAVPDYDAFWQAGAVRLPLSTKPAVMLHEFRADPQAHPLKTPSGRIELFSERVAAFGYEDCPGFAKWFEPAEWLGAAKAKQYPLHMLSDQPLTKLHSQLDFSSYSRSKKIAGREPVVISTADAAARGIADGDIVRVFNDRGSCLAGAVVSDGILAGVVKLSTGAWWDPERAGDASLPDRHGNPNTLTRDAGASRLSQGCSAQTCLVQVEKYRGAVPAMRAYEPPEFAQP
ncbi:molybdopterin-dependent oxidoreductase [Ramlibacter sp. G-1-2-2]|uniref:Molybdopterin-dependent oxidoreductase n=1 Tax=Ramlibacter agri TaxID=2728837 RepID=A0A848HBF4_9BURK|nr:molybdopterin-dependent oxidoreductase [Ramlibacter agri]NML46741.1 molybdopterin-dependent oxidoreductase [Ramlibacter agri]